MILQYVVKKTSKLFLAIFLLLLLLQFVCVQNFLLNLFLKNSKNNVSIKISNTNGFFPFFFFAKSIAIKANNFSVDVENFSVKTNPSCLSVAMLAIKNIHVKYKGEEGVLADSVKTFFSALGQNYVDNIKIDKIHVNNYSIDSFSWQRHLEKNRDLRFGKCEISKIPLSLKVEKKPCGLLFDAGYRDLKLVGKYASDSQNFSISFSDIFQFDGKMDLNSVVGNMKFPKLQTKIQCSFLFEKDLICCNFKCPKSKVGSRMKYFLSKKILLVDDVIFDKEIVLKSFFLDGNMRIKNIDLLVGLGRVNFTDVDLSSKNFSLGKILFEHVDLAKFSPLGWKISGYVDGNVAYQADQFSKSGCEKFSLKTNNIFYQNIKIPDLHVSGKYSSSHIDVNIVYDIFSKNSKIHFLIDVNKWTFSKNSKIKLNADGEFAFDNLFNLFNGQQNSEKPNNLLKGHVRYSVKANGKLFKPNLFGTIDLSEFVFLDSRFGFYVKDGSVQADIKNNKIFIKKLFCTDDSQKPGKIFGGGQIVADENGIFVDSVLTVDNFELVSKKDIDGRVFGKIYVQGNALKTVTLRADLFANNAKYDISNMLAAKTYLFSAINDVEKEKHVAKSVETQKNNNDIAKNIKLNARLVFKPNLRITGAGISSFWSGNMSASGTMKDVFYDGRFTLQKGRVIVSGKKFLLTNGNIFMNSKKPNIFDIDISAQKVIDKITVGAKFLQNGKSNNVLFFSTPHLSRKDMLSYLLFEKCASDISSTESLQLFSAITSLSENVVLNIFDKIKTALGIDIAIKQNKNSFGEKYEAMKIGKTIGKFNIAVDQGIGLDKTNVVLEAEIKKNMKISVNLAGKNSAGVGLFWSKKY